MSPWLLHMFDLCFVVYLLHLLLVEKGQMLLHLLLICHICYQLLHLVELLHLLPQQTSIGDLWVLFTLFDLSYARIPAQYQ